MAGDLDEYFVKEKSSMDRVLDFLVFIAVFAVTVFLILEIMAQAGKFDLAKINSIYLYINIGVFIIFAADLIRLWHESATPKEFFKKNWLDVLATIPFGIMGQVFQQLTAFNVLKWAKAGRLASMTKVQKLTRASKITKEFKAASHLKKEGEEYKRKHRL
jgi:hypothetical protein